MYNMDNRSKKYKEEANDISNAKTQKYKQLHSKSNTLSPDIAEILTKRFLTSLTTSWSLLR